jgi:hypothetical protein
MVFHRKLSGKEIDNKHADIRSDLKEKTISSTNIIRPNR